MTCVDLFLPTTMPSKAGERPNDARDIYCKTQRSKTDTREQYYTQSPKHPSPQLLAPNARNPKNASPATKMPPHGLLLAPPGTFTGLPFLAGLYVAGLRRGSGSPGTYGAPSRTSPSCARSIISANVVCAVRRSSRRRSAIWKLLLPVVLGSAKMLMLSMLSSRCRRGVTGGGAAAPVAVAVLVGSGRRGGAGLVGRPMPNPRGVLLGAGPSLDVAVDDFRNRLLTRMMPVAGLSACVRSDAPGLLGW